MNRTTIKAEPFPIATEARAVLIAVLNDEFRKTVLFEETGAGRAVLTQGVAALDPVKRAKLFLAIAGETRFDAENDPYGEHDFVSVEVEGETFFAKIDYFDDPWLTAASPDPANEAECYRVMTVMTAGEY